MIYENLLPFGNTATKRYYDDEFKVNIAEELKGVSCNFGALKSNLYSLVTDDIYCCEKYIKSPHYHSVWLEFSTG